MTIFFFSNMYVSKLLPIESYSTGKNLFSMCYYHLNLAQDLHLLQYCYITIGSKYFAFEYSNNFTIFFSKLMSCMYYIYRNWRNIFSILLMNTKSDNIIIKSLAPLLCIAEGRIVALYPLIAILPQMLLFFKVPIFYCRYSAISI